MDELFTKNPSNHKFFSLVNFFQYIKILPKKVNMEDLNKNSILFFFIYIYYNFI